MFERQQLEGCRIIFRQPSLNVVCYLGAANWLPVVTLFGNPMTPKTDGLESIFAPLVITSTPCVIFTGSSWSMSIPRGAKNSSGILPA